MSPYMLPMCSPAPAVGSATDRRPRDVLRQVLQHCGLLVATPGTAPPPPRYNELTAQCLSVLAKMSKTYPHVVLRQWSDAVAPTLLGGLTWGELRVRCACLSILGMLLEANSNHGNNYNNRAAAASAAASGGSRHGNTPLGVPLGVPGVLEFIVQHLPRAFADTGYRVRGAACGVLVHVQRVEWMALEPKAHKTFFAGIVSCCKDSNDKVQTQALMTLGCVCALPHFFADVEAYVAPAFGILLRVLGSESSGTPPVKPAVRSRAAWALANLCDVAGPVGNEDRPLSACPLSKLGRRQPPSGLAHVQVVTQVVVRLATPPQDASSNAVKTCASGMRALGSVAQYWLSVLGGILVQSEGSPERWMELSAASPALDMLPMCMERIVEGMACTDADKILWNACHAAGRVLGAIGQYDGDDSNSTRAEARRGDLASGSFCIVSGVGAHWIVACDWYSAVLRALATAVATCSNLKVRLHAAQAIARRRGRRDFGLAPNLLSDVLFGVVQSLQTCDDVRESNFELRYALKQDLAALVCGLVGLVDREDVIAHPLLQALFAEHAAFILGVVRERDRNTGLNMIQGDPAEMRDPQNASIVTDARAVLALYERLASLLAVATDTGDAARAVCAERAAAMSKILLRANGAVPGPAAVKGGEETKKEGALEVLGDAAAAALSETEQAETKQKKKKPVQLKNPCWADAEDS